MSVGSVVETLDLSAAAIASLLVAVAVIEAGGAMPFLVYLVTGTLSALLLPNKFIAAVYLLFAGIYPIFKAAFERRHYAVSWLLKFSFFNTSLLFIIAVTAYVMKLDGDIGFSAPVFVFGNLVFFLYDLAFTKLVTLYLVKIRAWLKLGNYFEN